MDREPQPPGNPDPPLRLLERRVSHLEARVSRLENLQGPAPVTQMQPPGASLFAFSRSAQRIYLNGNLVTRGLQAELLFQVLRRHQSERGRVMDHAEFRNDPDLFPDSRGANLELRLRRIGERLARLTLQIALVKVEPGRFRLRVTGLLSLVEE